MVIDASDCRMSVTMRLVDTTTSTSCVLIHCRSVKCVVPSLPTCVSSKSAQTGTTLELVVDVAHSVKLGQDSFLFSLSLQGRAQMEPMYVAGGLGEVSAARFL